MTGIYGRRPYTAELRAGKSADQNGEAVSAAEVLRALGQLGDQIRSGRRPANPPPTKPTISPEAAKVAAELAELSRRIELVKAEVGAIKHPLANTDRLKDATSHLGTIVDDMEVATDRILEGAEQVEATLSFMVVSGGGGDISKLNEEATALITRIMESCSFQDVSGQRVARVLKLFDEIEEHVTTIIHTFGAEAFANIPVAEIGDGGDEGVVLHGPQSGAGGISQGEIDALFD